MYGFMEARKKDMPFLRVFEYRHKPIDGSNYPPRPKAGAIGSGPPAGFTFRVILMVLSLVSRPPSLLCPLRVPPLPRAPSLELTTSLPNLVLPIAVLT